MVLTVCIRQTPSGINLGIGPSLESCGHVATAGSSDGALSASSPRLHISLGTSASAEVVEDFGPAVEGGASAAFTNAVAEVGFVKAHEASSASGLLQERGLSDMAWRGPAVARACAIHTSLHASTQKPASHV